MPSLLFFSALLYVLPAEKDRDLLYLTRWGRQNEAAYLPFSCGLNDSLKPQPLLSQLALGIRSVSDAAVLVAIGTRRE